MDNTIPLLLNNEHEYWMGINNGFSELLNYISDTHYVPENGDYILADGYDGIKVLDKFLYAGDQGRVLEIRIDWDSWADDEINRSPYYTFKEHGGLRDFFARSCHSNRSKIIEVQKDILNNNYTEEDEPSIAQKYHKKWG